MARQNTRTAAPPVTSPITTDTTPARTALGGRGFTTPAKSELYLLAVDYKGGSGKHHEATAARDARFVKLIRETALADPEWTAGLIGWLRAAGHMRTAPAIGAAEYVRVLTGSGLGRWWNPASGDWASSAEAGFVPVPPPRAVVRSALRRLDDVGEVYAYWANAYGRQLPKSLRRGLGDGLINMVTERSVLKFDSKTRAYRLADLLNLLHPGDTAGSAQHVAPWRADLFGYVTAKPYRPDVAIPTSLRMLTAHAELMAIPKDQRRSWLQPRVLAMAGMTWEAVAGWLQGPMDAQAWEAIIPSMGYMATLRNLRNFDEAGVSDQVAEVVAARLSDAYEVASSRQFLLSFLAAYQQAPSLRWGYALEKAVQLSMSNVPHLGGRTLIVIDRSPSMFPGHRFSTPTDSVLTCADQAAVFGVAIALRAASATVAVYGGESREVTIPAAGSLLRIVSELGDPINYTNTGAAVRKHYAGHDRVVIITDEQSGTDTDALIDSVVPSTVPIYTWNLGGYQVVGSRSGKNRHRFGGVTDEMFAMIPRLEAHRSGVWPWQVPEGTYIA